MGWGHCKDGGNGDSSTGSDPKWTINYCVMWQHTCPYQDVVRSGDKGVGVIMEECWQWWSWESWKRSPSNGRVGRETKESCQWWRQDWWHRSFRGHKHASGGVIEQIGKRRRIEWRILLVSMEWGGNPFWGWNRENGERRVLVDFQLEVVTKMSCQG